MGSLLLGKYDETLVVLEALKKHLDLIAHLDFLVLELGNGDDTLRLVTNVHEDDLRADFKDGTVHDVTLAEVRKLGVNQSFQFNVAHYNDVCRLMVNASPPRPLPGSS